MSKYHTEKINCPECGKEGEFILWSSINTMHNPEMKEKVRNNEAFKWTCPNCGKETIVYYTILYHQMEDHIMIYFVIGDPQQAIELFQGINRDSDGNIIEFKDTINDFIASKKHNENAKSTRSENH